MLLSAARRTDPIRRRFLLGAAAVAGLTLSGRSGSMLARPLFADYPFALGVASGDPQSDGFVLWTRLAPRPLQGGGMDEIDVSVDWVVAEDERLTRIVRRGSALAIPEWAHSVHVEVTGLEPDRGYYYGFRCAGESSPIGRSRTAPRPGSPIAHLRLALASCQHFEQGYFSAYRHMLADAPDLIVHVGDYIYEGGSWGAQVRRHEGDAAVTLDEYRNRHACYKLDPDLQRAHAACPWLLAWDDHEVENDYAADTSTYGERRAAFVERRTAAYRAYYEHMPLRARSRPIGESMLMHTRIDFGDLVQIHLLDDRQYRSPHACATADQQHGIMVTDCPQRFSAQQNLLGAPQERWLHEGMAASRSCWNVIAQQTLMAPFESRQPDGQYAVWTDGWDGYAGSRSRLLEHIARAQVRNAIVLGGDVHAYYVNDLTTDFSDERAPVVATEFVGTSITSADVDYAAVMRDLPRNPHVRFFDSRWRGYLKCDITRKEWRSDLRIVEDATDPQSDARTLASFTVEDGRAGAQI
jgi:alkaline phosphatase D